MSTTANWGGYEFGVYDKNANWSDTGGIYIFAGVSLQKTWVALYIGIADNFSSRLSGHERWDEARRRGASHVHALEVLQEAKRASIEAKLIADYQPVLNEHHK